MSEPLSPQRDCKCGHAWMEHDGPDHPTGQGCLFCECIAYQAAKSRPYEVGMRERLRDRNYAREYLLAFAGEDEPAIRYIAEAHLKQPAEPARTEGLELPACAAIRYGDVILADKRHHNCLAIAAALNLPRDAANIGNQGFMTTLGRFVNRREALALRKAAGLESADPGGYRGDQLYSEDLY